MTPKSRRLHEPSARKGERDAEDDARGREHRALANHHPQNVGGRGAERNAHTHLGMAFAFILAG